MLKTGQTGDAAANGNGNAAAANVEEMDED